MAEKTQNRLTYVIKEWVLPIATALILAYVINTFVVFRIEVPTGSMIPTINVDDKIFVRKVYNKDQFSRGDILVFRSEELFDDEGKPLLLIKRLIGLPGEHIEFREGDLYINGSFVEEPYVVHESSFTGTFLVPKDHYFFVGDNRRTSNDARYWEEPYIRKDLVLGKGGLRILPIKDFGFLE